MDEMLDGIVADTRRSIENEQGGLGNETNGLGDEEDGLGGEEDGGEDEEDGGEESSSTNDDSSKSSTGATTLAAPAAPTNKTAAPSTNFRPAAHVERPSSWRQLHTLLHKRWTIARRDRKGFFFQVVLPVLLIVLVLLVLTIDVRLAGPPIRMNAALYRDFYAARGDAGGGRFGDSTEVLHATANGEAYEVGLRTVPSTSAVNGWSSKTLQGAGRSVESRAVESGLQAAEAASTNGSSVAGGGEDGAEGEYAHEYGFLRPTAPTYAASLQEALGLARGIHLKHMTAATIEGESGVVDAKGGALSTDSLRLSQYMLRTYNDHNFATRFGAYCIDDTIHVNITHLSETMVRDRLCIGLVCHT
jgi:hypothetical protein